MRTTRGLKVQYGGFIVQATLSLSLSKCLGYSFCHFSVKMQANFYTKVKVILNTMFPETLPLLHKIYLTMFTKNTNESRATVLLSYLFVQWAGVAAQFTQNMHVNILFSNQQLINTVWSVCEGKLNRHWSVTERTCTRTLSCFLLCQHGKNIEVNSCLQCKYVYIVKTLSEQSNESSVGCRSCFVLVISKLEMCMKHWVYVFVKLVWEVK